MSQNWQELSTLVVGCGSIGKRHSRVLRELGVKTLFVCDPFSSRWQRPQKRYRMTVQPAHSMRVWP